MLNSAARLRACFGKLKYSTGGGGVRLSRYEAKLVVARRSDLAKLMLPRGLNAVLETAKAPGLEGGAKARTAGAAMTKTKAHVTRIRDFVFLSRSCKQLPLLYSFRYKTQAR